MGDCTKEKQAWKNTRWDERSRGGLLQKLHEKEKTEAKLGVRNMQARACSVLASNIEQYIYAQQNQHKKNQRKKESDFLNVKIAVKIIHRITGTGQKSTHQART